MNSRRFAALALAVLMPLSFHAPAQAQVLPGVGTVRVDSRANALTLIVPYPARQPFRLQWLNGPRRLVLDIEGLIVQSAANIPVGTTLVRNIRASRFGREVTRVVFDLTGPADLLAVTDSASMTLQITVFPRGARPTAAGPTASAARPAPTPRPASTPRPQPTPRPASTPTPGVTPPPILLPLPSPVPQARITPVPVFPSFPDPTPQPTPTPQPAAPRPGLIPALPPEPPPSPLPDFERPSPEPLLRREPEPDAAMASAANIFGSRVFGGVELPLVLSETYLSGGSQSRVTSPIPGGAFGWDHMLTQNIGLSVSGRGMSYTLADLVAEESGFEVLHRRDDYEGALNVRGLLPLGGFHLMGQAGFMGRMVRVASTLDQQSELLDTYLYSGWTGFGPTATAGLGWNVWGPLSLAATGEYNMLLGGAMTLQGVRPIFPLTGLRLGGEAQWAFGGLGLALGYNMTNYTHAQPQPEDTLTQSWSGPYLKLHWTY